MPITVNPTIMFIPYNFIIDFVKIHSKLFRKRAGYPGYYHALCQIKM